MDINIVQVIMSRILLTFLIYRSFMETQSFSLIDGIPYDTRLEQDLIGSLLFNNDYYEAIKHIIKPVHFHSRQHADLYKIIEKHLIAGERITESILLEYIRSNKLENLVGGIHFLLGLQERLLDMESAVSTAKKIREIYARRECIAQSVKLISICKGSEEDFESVAMDKISDMQKIITSTLDSQCVSFQDAVDKFFLELASEDGRKILPTGFPILDSLLNGGFRPGSLIVLAARPSMGKTSLAMDIAYNISLQKFTTLMISVEMSNSDIACRGISRFSGVPYNDIMNSRFMLDENKQANVIRARKEEINRVELFLKDSSVMINELVTTVTAFKNKNKLDFVVIDYLQLIGTEGKRESKNIQVSDITRAIKLMALKLEIPVLLLSQLSRELERREDKRPVLSDLRDSGAIEQDADLVFFLYRDSVYNNQCPTPNDVELSIAKFRNGRRGLIHVLEFNGKIMSFKEKENVSVQERDHDIDYNDPRGNDL